MTEKEEVQIGKFNFNRWLILIIIALLMFGLGYFTAYDKANSAAYEDATEALNEYFEKVAPLHPGFMNVNNTIVINDIENGYENNID